MSSKGYEEDLPSLERRKGLAARYPNGQFSLVLMHRGALVGGIVFRDFPLVCQFGREMGGISSGWEKTSLGRENR